MEQVGLLPNGSMLFREPDPVGGYSYYSDEIVGGVFIWNSSSVEPTTLLAAIVEHERFVIEQYHDNKGKTND